MAKNRKSKKDKLAKAVLDPTETKVPQTWDQGFGPGRPAESTRLAQAGVVEPRKWNFLTGLNRSSLPRLDQQTYEGVTFENLRWLSRENALIRGAIEWRKQQLQRLTFAFKPKDADVKAEDHPNAVLVSKIMAKPDGRQRFKAWLNCIVEDVLVCDNVYVYPDVAKKDDRIVFRLIDPATVKRYVNEKGEAPLEDDAPAYAQVIQGFPAVQFSFDQLFSSQRNPSTDRLYGYGPVEQVQDYVSLAIRRLQYQEAYYTEGNTPESMVTLPEKMGPDQIAEFQQLFDDLDSMDAKRRIRMMPFGTSLLTTKDQVLKDQTDEWVARVICWLFQVPASALITDNNRATAETQKKANEQDGLVPFMDFIKSVVDELIVEFLGIDDVEFVWEQDEGLDSLTQSQVDAVYLDRGVLEVNEVRKRLGYDPLAVTDRFAPTDEDAAAERMLAAMGQLDEAPAPAAKPGQDPVVEIEAAAPAIDGAQISSLTSILAQVADGTLPAATASVLIGAAFPKLTPEQVAGMVNPIAQAKAAEPPAPAVDDLEPGADA